MGQALESGLGTCLVATRFAEHLGMSLDDQRRVFYLALLQHVGCTAMNHDLAAAIGDEITMRSGAAALDFFDPDVAGPYLRAVLARAFPGLGGVELQARIRSTGDLFREGRSAACEVAQMLCQRLGFDDEIRRDLGGVYERFDGTGHPGRARGEELSLRLRVVQVADGARNLHDAGGLDAVSAVLPRRAGAWYQAELVEAFLSDARPLLADLEAPARWDEVLHVEPQGPTILAEDRLDDVLGAMAEFQDLKSPYLVTHSTGVAALAEQAARRIGLPEADARALKRAGWIHDLGRVGVSASLWGKPAGLTAAEWEQVRLHAYHTDRVLARIPRADAADPFAITSLHHERNDGSGYFRGLPASLLPMTARILAAADAYHAMRESRPHRPALDRAAAATELGREVRAGRIDPDAARAVLEAAGEPHLRRRTSVAGLTAREVEVLRLLARGLSIREIAQALAVSPKTADKHVENIYSKAEVSTRAAATLFAIRHDLLA